MSVVATADEPKVAPSIFSLMVIGHVSHFVRLAHGRVGDCDLSGDKDLVNVAPTQRSPGSRDSMTG